YPGIFFIYKKIWDKTNKNYLTLNKMIQIGLIDPTKGVSLEILNQYNLELIDNTEDEILDAVCDMEAQLKGTLQTSEEDNVAQGKFIQIFSTVRKNQNIFIRISPSFYRNGAVLFESTTSA